MLKTLRHAIPFFPGQPSWILHPAPLSTSPSERAWRHRDQPTRWPPSARHLSSYLISQCSQLDSSVLPSLGTRFSHILAHSPSSITETTAPSSSTATQSQTPPTSTPLPPHQQHVGPRRRRVQCKAVQRPPPPVHLLPFTSLRDRVTYNSQGGLPQGEGAPGASSSSPRRTKSLGAAPHFHTRTRQDRGTKLSVNDSIFISCSPQLVQLRFFSVLAYYLV